MDSCCLTLKPNTHLGKASKGGLSLGNNGFWGERITGSLNNNAWVNQLAKSCRTEKKVTTLKPGVAFAILTSNNAKEAMVS
jgi:glucose-1-phosphate adenylyltransferase